MAIAYDYYGGLFKKQTGRPSIPVAQGSVPQATAPASPELAGMEKSPYAGFLGKLGEPITIPYANLQQQRYNIMRGEIQGATRTAGEQMKTWMGGKGFRAGEAGIADVPLMKIGRGGQELLSRGATTLATEESERARQTGISEATLNLQRLLGGAQLGLAGEEGIQNRLLQYLALLSGTEQQRWQPYWGAAGSVFGG